MLDVVTLGEAMLLFVAEETGPLEQVQRFSKRTAGAETNVAIGLARLGLKVGWQSRLGDDSMARYLLAAIGGEGVDCSRVVCVATQRSVDYLPTRDFAMRPRLWLTLISRNRCTVSFSPPFGYTLCARRLRPGDAEALDLSAWRAWA